MKKSTIASIIMLTIVLSGCNSNTETDTSATNSTSTEVSTTENSTVEISETENSTVELSETEKTLKEDLDNASNDIWYKVDTVDKDTKVRDFYVFNDGKVSIYEVSTHDSRKTLGELSNMSDEEVMSYFKEERSKVDLAAMEETLSRVYSTEPVPYKLNLTTDSTGNSVMSETISADFLIDAQGEGDSFIYTFSSSNAAQYVIYQQEYIGFNVGYRYDDPFEDSDGFLIRRRKSENDMILRDTLDTEGVTIDER